MEILNTPIQLISSCSTLGDFIPLRFRYEDASHHLQIVTVEDVLSSKPVRVAGTDSILYTCSAIIEEQRKIFTLKYFIKSHKWTIYQILS